MDKYAAIDKYEARINELEGKKELILFTIRDKDAKHRDCATIKIGEINLEIAIYVDVIETIGSLEF